MELTLGFLETFPETPKSVPLTLLSYEVICTMKVDISLMHKIMDAHHSPNPWYTGWACAPALHKAKRH